MRLIDDNGNDIISNFETRINELENNKIAMETIITLLNVKYQNILSTSKDLSKETVLLSTELMKYKSELDIVKEQLKAKEDRGIINTIKALFTRKNDIKETTINLE